MRKFVVPAIALGSVLAFPAFAATASNNNTNAANNPPRDASQIQQDLTQSLTKAGFTDIKIMPGSFLVHAKDPKGNPTEMMVSPNSITEITAVEANGTHTNQSGAPSSGTQNKQ